MSLSKLWKMVKDRETWHAAIHGVTESDMTEWLNNNLNVTFIFFTPEAFHYHIFVMFIKKLFCNTANNNDP